MKRPTRQQRPTAFRPGAEGLKQSLGDLEADIMDFVWRAEERSPGAEVSVREAVQDLTAKRAVVYATVKTVMNRLVDKGLLIRRKEDRAFLYRSPVSRQEYWRRLCGSVLEGLIGGAERGVVLSHLVDSVTAQDTDNLDHLERLIDRKRRELREARPGGEPPR